MTISDDYFAGLFDGEGWFNIRRVKASHYRGTRQWAFQCSTNLVMREKSILIRMQERFGGNLNDIKNRSSKHSPYFSWRLGGLDSLKFAYEMKDLLIAKREQSLILIEFQKEKIENGNSPLPDERYEKYCLYYDQMKRLNEKGIGKV
jgi:hypothetical protein